MSLKNINWNNVFLGDKEKRKGKFKKAVKSNLIELFIALLLAALFFGSRWASSNGLFDKDTLESQFGTAITSEDTRSLTAGKVQSFKDINFEALSDEDICIEVNGNTPYFVSDPNDNFKLAKMPYEEYCNLDNLGRCGVAQANICSDVMPGKDEQRAESLSNVTPSGYQVVRDEDIDKGFLYNRCHLIAYQLAGENDNEKNLITGTRQFNVDGMQPFETKVAYYIYDHPDNHVAFRVTPIFLDNELVARGVLMEAYSIEDNGRGVCYCVFIPNVQRGYSIDYMTGHAIKKG